MSASGLMPTRPPVGARIAAALRHVWLQLLIVGGLLWLVLTWATHRLWSRSIASAVRVH